MAKDLKYGYLQVEQDSERHPINGTDEPVFVLRANDATSGAVLEFYYDEARRLGADDDHLNAVSQALGEFTAWQKSSPGSVKTPD